MEEWASGLSMDCSRLVMIVDDDTVAGAADSVAGSYLLLLEAEAACLAHDNRLRAAEAPPQAVPDTQAHWFVPYRGPRGAPGGPDVWPK